MPPDRHRQDRRRLLLTGLACTAAAFLLGALWAAGGAAVALATGRGAV